MDEPQLEIQRPWPKFWDTHTTFNILKGLYVLDAPPPPALSEEGLYNVKNGFKHRWEDAAEYAKVRNGDITDFKGGPHSRMNSSTVFHGQYRDSTISWCVLLSISCHKTDLSQYRDRA